VQGPDKVFVWVVTSLCFVSIFYIIRCVAVRSAVLDNLGSRLCPD